MSGSAGSILARGRLGPWGYKTVLRRKCHAVRIHFRRPNITPLAGIQSPTYMRLVEVSDLKKSFDRVKIASKPVNTISSIIKISFLF